MVWWRQIRGKPVNNIFPIEDRKEFHLKRATSAYAWFVLSVDARHPACLHVCYHLGTCNLLPIDSMYDQCLLSASAYTYFKKILFWLFSKSHKSSKPWNLAGTLFRRGHLVPCVEPKCGSLTSLVQLRFDHLISGTIVSSLEVRSSSEIGGLLGNSLLSTWDQLVNGRNLLALNSKDWGCQFCVSTTTSRFIRCQEPLESQTLISG